MHTFSARTVYDIPTAKLGRGINRLIRDDVKPRLHVLNPFRRQRTLNTRDTYTHTSERVHYILSCIYTRDSSRIRNRRRKLYNI